MKKLLLLAAALTIALPTGAFAAVDLTSTDGTVPYSGPTPTIDFESVSPLFSGGTIKTGSGGGDGAQPYGSTGNYATMNSSTPGTLDLSSFGDIDFVSFIWGSIDLYNTLQILDADGTIFKTFTGNDFALANGNRTDPETNRLVKLTFTDGDQSRVNKLVFRSSDPAFEIDNIAFGAVPEPTTWMLMLMGMAGIGFSMRRKEKQTVRVRFA